VIVTTRQGCDHPTLTGGSVTDTQARTAIASILTALRNHGLIA
jgi:hypothetical protein